MKLTKKETDALIAIAYQGLECMGGETPADLHDDNMSWFNSEDLVRDLKISQAQARGIMSALFAKRLIADGGGSDWYLTHSGIDEAERLDKEDAKEAESGPSSAVLSKQEADSLLDLADIVRREQPYFTTANLMDWWEIDRLVASRLVVELWHKGVIDIPEPSLDGKLPRWTITSLGFEVVEELKQATRGKRGKPSPVRLISSKLIEGDPLAPNDHDLIVQKGLLQVREPVPEGWRVLKGNLENSLVARVAYRFECA